VQCHCFRMMNAYNSELICFCCVGRINVDLDGLTIGGFMQPKVVYVTIAALAFGSLSALSPQAWAGDNTYFKVLTPKTEMRVKSDSVTRTVETSTSYPVMIARDGHESTILEGATLMPVMLEKTSVAKPHHLPFSFGVWP
jgi:hypothetical protein